MNSLEKKYNDLLNKNEADSYYTYVSKNGVKAEKKYHEALVNADTARMLSSADYGAAAERLNTSGLNRSGYEDYINSQGLKTYASKLKKAEEVRMVDEYKNRTGYKNYLSDYESIQMKISESVIKKISEGDNLNFEDAYLEALNAGISKSLAYATAKEGVEKATEKVAVKALDYAKINGLSAEEAQNHALELGLDEDTAKRIYKEIFLIRLKEEESDTTVSADDYFDYIKGQTNK